MRLNNPCLIGFGISNKTTLESAQNNSNGAIIGSKFITLLKESASIDDAIVELKTALRE